MHMGSAKGGGVRSWGGEALGRRGVFHRGGLGTEETHLRCPQVCQIFEVDQKVRRHCISPKQQRVSHNLWRHAGVTQPAVLPVLLHTQAQTLLRPQALDCARQVRQDLVLLLLHGTIYWLVNAYNHSSMHFSKSLRYLQLLCTANVNAATRARNDWNTQILLILAMCVQKDFMSA